MQKKVILAGIFILIFSFSGAAFSETKVFFSPNGGCTDAIVKAISQAQKTIDIMMYSFSSRPIAQAEKFNAENLLRMTDPALIKPYQERFNYLWGKGR